MGMVTTFITLLVACLLFSYVAEEMFWDGRDDALNAVREMLDKGAPMPEVRDLVLHEIRSRPPPLLTRLSTRLSKSRLARHWTGNH